MREADGARGRAITPTSREDSHLFNLLGAFVSSVGDELASALSDEAGLGGSDSAAVLAVDTWPGCSIDFLARVVQLTHSGTVRLVNRLESGGILQRLTGGDARTAALRLTRFGQGLAARLRQRRAEVLSHALAEADPMEKEVLRRTLDRALRARSRSRMEARSECRLCDHTVCMAEDCPIGSSVDE